MARDPFAVFGLAPGSYDPTELARRYILLRAGLLAALNEPGREVESRRQLEELHVAFRLLRDPRQQAALLRRRGGAADPAGELRALIAASLEDGLLRYSRRQAILERAAELGFNEFQAHLLIAQVQFGDEGLDPTPSRETVVAVPPQAWARAAGVGVLALALFLALVAWLGG